MMGTMIARLLLPSTPISLKIVDELNAEYPEPAEARHA